MAASLGTEMRKPDWDAKTEHHMPGNQDVFSVKEGMRNGDEFFVVVKREESNFALK